MIKFTGDEINIPPAVAQIQKLVDRSFVLPTALVGIPATQDDAPKPKVLEPYIPLGSMFQEYISTHHVLVLVAKQNHQKLIGSDGCNFDRLKESTQCSPSRRKKYF